MTEEGQVIGCHTKDKWTEQFNRGKETNKLVVIDFTASWCGPCRVIAPILADYAKRFLHVIFVKIDVDEMPEVAKEFNVEAMPSFVFLKDGVEIERIVGAKKDELLATITKHAGETVAA